MSEYPPGKKITKEDIKKNPRVGLKFETPKAGLLNLQKQLEGMESKSLDMAWGTLRRRLDQLSLKYSKEEFFNLADDIKLAEKEMRARRRSSLRAKSPGTEGDSYQGEPRYPVPAIPVHGVRYDGAPHFPVPTVVGEAQPPKPTLPETEFVPVSETNIPVEKLAKAQQPQGESLDKEFPRITKTAEGAESDTPVAEQTQAEQKAKLINSVVTLQELSREDREKAAAQRAGTPEAYRKVQEAEQAYLEALKAANSVGKGQISHFEKVQRTVTLHTLKERYDAERLAYETAREKRADLLADRADVKEERDAMYAAGKRYFDAQKNLHKSGMSKADSGPELEEAMEAERQYVLARKAYANALETSLDTRMNREDRGVRKDMTPEQRAKLQERYDRGVRAKAILNEVIKPGAELKDRARLEGLNEKGKGVFGKMLSWYADKNQQLEEWATEKFGSKGKYAAAAIRAVSTGVVIGVPVGVISATFGSAGIMAATGWGALKLGRSIASAVTGTGLTETGFGAYDRKWGKEKRKAAREELARTGTDKLSGITEEYLAGIDARRGELAKKGDESAALRQKAIMRLFVSLGVGGASAALTEFAIHEFAQLPPVAGGAPPSPHSPGAGSHALPGHAGEAVLGKGNVTELPALESVTAEHGMGGIRMLKALKGGLKSMHTPAMDVLRNADPTKLAEKLGLYHPGAAGGLENLEVPKGSTMAFANNGELVLTLKGGQSLSLLDSSGNVIPHTPDEIGRFIGLNHAAESAAAPTETAHNTDHSSDIYHERELNRIHAAEAQQGTSARAAVPPTEPVPRTPRYAPEAAPPPSDQYVPADRQPAAPSVREAVPTPAGRPEVIPPEAPRGASIPHETSAPPSAPPSEVPQPESFTSSGTEVPFGRITLPPSETALVADHAGRLTMAGADADQQFIDAQKYVIGLKDPNATVLIHDYVTDNLGTRVPIVSLVQYDAARGTARVIIGDPTQYPAPSPDESVRLVRTFSKSS